MARINKNYKRLVANYLFTEVARRTHLFLLAHPDVKLHKLGIGSTTEPIPPSILAGLRFGVEKLGKRETYRGYGNEGGDIRLRQNIADWYAERDLSFDASEIFISDGAKTDLANIQNLFSKENVVAVQDPVYPVYVDSNVIAGRSGIYKNGQYKKIVYLPCNEENNFIPLLPKGHVDLIYLCSPNNPTAAVMKKEDLKKFIAYARSHKAVIIFDGAYSSFIQDPDLPRSIYEISGAKQCAIEINSFSKSAGFTGVRLGWTIVPRELLVEGTREGELTAMWQRRQSTLFNGVSNIVQEGGLALLTRQGRKDCQKLVAYYMQNAKLIKTALVALGFTVYGGDNAPYIWVKNPRGMTSWEFFDFLLEKAHIITTPGSGFGSNGEGFIRISAFGHREDIKDAIKSMQKELNAIQ